MPSYSHAPGTAAVRDGHNERGHSNSEIMAMPGGAKYASLRAVSLAVTHRVKHDHVSHRHMHLHLPTKPPCTTLSEIDCVTL